MVAIHIGMAHAHSACWWPDGATWAADFATGRYMVGGMPVPWDSACTLSRGSAKFAPDTDGRLKLFAADMPARTDLGLLIEPAATNLCTHSSDLTDASWVKNSCALTQGQLDPTGGNGAILVEEQNTGALLRRQSNLAVSSGHTYTVSRYVKRSNTDWCRQIIGDGTSLANAAWAWFNLQTGTNGMSGETGTGFGYQSHQCEILADYVKISTTVVAPSGTMNIGLVTAAGDGQTARANIGSGPGIGGALIVWNTQVELGASPTSPIVTASTTATRAADALQLATPDAQSLTIGFSDNTSQILPAPIGPFTLPASLDRPHVLTIHALVV